MDCLAQYNAIEGLSGDGREVQIFSASIDEQDKETARSRHISELPSWLEADGSSAVIYHWRDGNPGFDGIFRGLNARKIIRWHNNTPPWFFAPYAASCTANTLRGFHAIRDFVLTDTEFWANSAYSAQQLVTLGAAPERVRVIYPVSPILSAARHEEPAACPQLLQFVPNPRHPLRMLFVGRFVPHKGHRHLVATAALVQQITGSPVELNLVGRSDPAMQRYVDEVHALAHELKVTLLDHGELPDAALEATYRRCDVFLQLSEHEGFGLPALEAMRFDLPVVGVRIAATAECLARHPLSFDHFDYATLARAVIATTVPGIRAAVLRWQRHALAARYPTSLASRQIESALFRTPAPEVSLASPDTAAEAAIEAALSTAPPASVVPESLSVRLRAIPAEASGRFVTLHDLNAYATLLQSPAEPNADLYKRVWRQGFPKKRRLPSKIFRMFRRFVLSLNFGIVAAIDEARRATDTRINRLSSEVGALKEQNARILQKLDQMTEERPSRKASEEPVAVPMAAHLPTFPHQRGPELEGVPSRNGSTGIVVTGR